MSESNFLIAHIMKLPQATRNRILESEFSCQALLSALTPLAKQYALRIAFSGEADRRIVDSWPLRYVYSLACGKKLNSVRLLHFAFVCLCLSLTFFLVCIWLDRFLLSGFISGTPLIPNYSDKASQAQHDKAVKELLDLGIWTKVSSVSTGVGSDSFKYALHDSFAGKIQEILQTGLSSLWSEPSSELRASLPTRDELVRHAQSCWDSLLLFLSGREDMALAVSEQASSLPMLNLSETSTCLDLEDIFTRLNLMQRGSGNRKEDKTNDNMELDRDGERERDLDVQPLRTTGEGFKFLLKPPSDQIWTILDEFLKMQYDLKEEEGAAAVSFLLQLGFCEEGRVCRMDEFGEWEAKATRALSQLGLLYPFKRLKAKGKGKEGEGGEEEEEEEIWILPTHLSKLLSGGGGQEGIGSSGLGSGSGWGSLGALQHTAADSKQQAVSSSEAADTEEGIVVETNYRVYAYTSSLLKRAILELFCVQEYVMPNLFVGRLTRESCTAAFEGGIEAEAIVDYLRRNAHPQALKIRNKAPVVPETIGDGIRLWEAESQRMKMEAAAYYDNFESAELFNACVEHVKSRGVSLWVDSKKQRMAIKLSYHGSMRSFIKTKKLELASQ